jgi:membrane protease YdiL (CAAX protease family)
MPDPPHASRSGALVAMTSSAIWLSRVRDLSVALLVAGLVISGEYFFRHYVMFWLPVFGALSVNDMLSLFLFYSLLLAGLTPFLHTNWRQELSATARSLREGLKSWHFTLWVVALISCVWILSSVDRLLWGRIPLPMIVSSRRNPILLLAALAPVLKVGSLIVVNGMIVPIAEEYLWRGLIQVRLMRALSAPLAIGTTAVLFSLKHALVDASLGRLMALIAFGVITGIVAQAGSWRQSAALHMVVNTLATVTGLFLSSG